MFDKVIFAGGGHRCWWQAGFWEVLRAEIELRPRVIGAVSTGAFMACLVHANDSRRALAWFERELAGVRTNIEWLNLFRRGESMFRQGPIYRKAIRALLGGEHFRQLLWQAPEMRILYAVPPAGMSERQAGWAAWRAWRRDARMVPMALHGAPEGPQGFRAGIKRLQDCRTEREMVELLWGSSCTPPLMSVAELDDEPAYDGGLVDPVPVRLVDDVPGQTLVLTTRRYAKRTPVFASAGKIYVQPSLPVAASGWDFTSPRRFQKTYEQGRQDAEAFLRLFGLGAFHQATQFGGVLLGGGLWPGESRHADALGEAPSTDRVPTDVEALLGDETDGLKSEVPADQAADRREEGSGRENDAEAVPAAEAAVAASDAASGVVVPEASASTPEPAGEGRREGGSAAAPGAIPEEDDFQHTLGDLSDKLFDRGRRRSSSQ